MDAETMKLLERILVINQDLADMNRIIIETLCPVEMPVFAVDDSDGGPTMQ